MHPLQSCRHRLWLLRVGLLCCLWLRRLRVENVFGRRPRCRPTIGTCSVGSVRMTLNLKTERKRGIKENQIEGGGGDDSDRGRDRVVFGWVVFSRRDLVDSRACRGHKTQSSPPLEQQKRPRLKYTRPQQLHHVPQHNLPPFETPKSSAPRPHERPNSYTTFPNAFRPRTPNQTQGVPVHAIQED